MKKTETVSFPLQSCTGPGSHLRNIFRSFGVPKCPGCGGLSKKMNEWGAAGCDEHFDEIVEDIYKRNLAWWQKLKLTEKYDLFQKWEASKTEKIIASGRAIFDMDGEFKRQIANLTRQAIEAARRGDLLPQRRRRRVPTMRALAVQNFPLDETSQENATACGCCCFECQDPAPCNWAGLTCPPGVPAFSFTCVCLTIEAVDEDCDCLAGDYVLPSTVFVQHLYGVFITPDPCHPDGNLTIQISDSESIGGCSGCLENATVLYIECGCISCVPEVPENTPYCVPLCGTATAEELFVEGYADICCGCAKFTLTYCP